MREYPMPSTLRDYIAVDIEPSSTLAWQNRVEVMRRRILQSTFAWNKAVIQIRL